MTERLLALPDPPPASEEPVGASCDWGHCADPSVGWRWDRQSKRWLPVCARHFEQASPNRRASFHDCEEAAAPSV